jgi:BirA family biotin operon repressor/biotin-[acetyl-CoA-carboxylase] ligase
LPQPPFHYAIGSPFIELQTVDSTNNYARQLLHENRLSERQDLAQHGTAIFAHEQVAGKGQRGKAWASEKGANIILSLLVKPQSLRLTQQFQLSVCVVVAVHDFFIKYSGEGAKIKWPNDIYWQDRKAGGILIENIVGSREAGGGSNSVVAQWDWSIIGIGININQTAFPLALTNPVSLKQITGKNFDTISLAKEVCEALNKRFFQFLTEGFEKIYAQYLMHLYKLNAMVKFRKDNRVFEAIVKGVTPTGQLVIFHSIEEEINFGEVEWII